MFLIWSQIFSLSNSMWASYSVEKWCKWVKRLQHSSLSLWIIWAVSGIPEEVPGTKGTIPILWNACDCFSKLTDWGVFPFNFCRIHQHKRHYYQILLAAWKKMLWITWWCAWISSWWSKGGLGHLMPGIFLVITLNHGSSSSISMETTWKKICIKPKVRHCKFCCIFWTPTVRFGYTTAVVFPMVWMLCNHTNKRVVAAAEVDKIVQ